MPSVTGYWDRKEAIENHLFSYKLARWLGWYLDKRTVIDMGCGMATYLKYFHDIGFQNLYGVEGDTQDFEYENVTIQDLTQPFDLEVTGNVVCLEVGEHIPVEYTDVFFSNLINHLDGRLIISWAISGQGGYGHVNCRPNIYVIGEMQSRGLKLNYKDTMDCRSIIEKGMRVDYFAETLMIFEHV